MMKRVLPFLFSAVLLAAPLALTTSCQNPEEPEKQEQDFQVLINITTPLEVYAGQEISFTSYSNKGPQKTDQVVLKSSSREIVCPITSAGNENFTFKITGEVESGDYTFCIKRGDVLKTIGKIHITVIKVTSVEPKEGYNVFGTVTCGDQGVEGVVVTDGIDFTTTDKDGIFYLKCSEKYGLAYITVPSGYEVATKGVVPQFFKALDGNSSTTERADFSLVKVSGQDTHTMLFFGDMHLANRTSDLKQFHVFTKEVNQYLKDNAGKHIYAQSLGDMTWDLYWYANKMLPDDYLKEINSDFPDGSLTLWHCMGNHDHEMGSIATGFPIGDFNCEVAYRRTLGPNFYSYNVGKVHYIVIDDIECTNPGTQTSSSGNGQATRSYNTSVVSEQLEWLSKDLSYVDKSTPVVLISHAPVYKNNGTSNLTNTSALLSHLAGYTTYFITGHTHRMYNIDKLSDATTKNIELNSGSVCGSWWWTGHDTDGLNLATDGSNGGYRVFEVNGTEIKWYYKSTGKDADVQFRTYDGNKVSIDTKNFSDKASKPAAPWNNESRDNYVYIQVWDYDPAWKVEVTEDGKNLQTTRLSLYDPLHYIAYEAKGHDSFTTTQNVNMFRVKASSATSTLEIKVTDRFGRVYTETMKRPKAFSIAEYK